MAPTSAVVGVDRQKVEMADFKRHGELMDGHDGRIAPAVLQTAQILLAETRAQGELFLRQALLPTQARKVAADQFAHVHACLMAGWSDEVYQL